MSSGYQHTVPPPFVKPSVRRLGIESVILSHSIHERMRRVQNQGSFGRMDNSFPPARGKGPSDECLMGLAGGVFCQGLR